MVSARVTGTPDLPAVHRARVIPVLLLKKGLLYKTVKFRNAKYVGDPQVAVKIFNDKGIDELVILDIDATPQGTRPDFALLEDIAAESFMPLAYGGGVRTLDDVKTVVCCGYEKIILGAIAIEKPAFVSAAAELLGSSSVVVCIDVARDLLGRRRVVSHSAHRRSSIDPVQFAERMVAAGAGELIIQSVSQDGTFSGYDIDLIRRIAHAVDVPTIALGGARDVSDLAAAVNDGGAAAAAAGSMFVFRLPHRAVLITFPEEAELRRSLAHRSPASTLPGRESTRTLR